MKKNQLFLLLVVLLFFVSCNKEKEIKSDVPLTKISGYVQKGPFLNGTTITISELSIDLVPTGKNYPSQILDNKGTFEVKNIELTSQYVELKADGFYFNEVSNSNSAAQLTLYALSDLTNKESLNVNVLSTLEKSRVGYLISNGKNFADAKKQAQAEILDIFEITKADMTESEELDISQSGDDNAILLAISVILQGYSSESDLSELLANISTDIREDGVLNSQTLGSNLINNARKIKPDQISKNLTARYETLGMTVNIPDFEKYIYQFISQTDFLYKDLPELATNKVTDVKTTSAVCGGNIVKEGISAVTARGICWSTEQNPDIDDSKTADGIGVGSFTSDLLELTPNTIYYVRAYATNSAGTTYGNQESFKTGESGVGTVTDIDGNVYHTVTIGTQVWMLENLKTTKYRNGETIPNIPDSWDWGHLITGAFCWYDNNIANKANYSAMYNWYAVSDSRSIAPTGWHIPTDAEWTTLTTFLGGTSVAGGKLKENSTSYWTSPNVLATNESGFSAHGSGYRFVEGSFYTLNLRAYFWSSSQADELHSWYRYIQNNDGKVYRDSEYKVFGQSVRCIKD